MASLTEEVSADQVVTHETSETASWKSEPAIVAMKRVMIAERRTGR